MDTGNPERKRVCFCVRKPEFSGGDRNIVKRVQGCGHTGGGGPVPGLCLCPTAAETLTRGSSPPPAGHLRATPVLPRQLLFIESFPDLFHQRDVF